MLNELAQQFASQIQTFLYIMMLINGVIHLIFAGAVAHDGGTMNQMGQRTVLVSAATWAFATLIGGVFIAAIYWLLHHSTFTRPLREVHYDQP